MVPRRLPLVSLLLILAGCGGGGSAGSAGSSEPTEPSGPPRIVWLTNSFGATLTDVSADGSVIVGYSGSQGTPLVWREPGNGPENLDTGSVAARLYAVSADGQQILGGAGAVDVTPGIVTLFGPAGERTVLPTPEPGSPATGIDLSDDGTVALCREGVFQGLGGPSPKPYTVRGGTATYLPIPEGASAWTASALSGDGNVVAGTIDGKAAIWTGSGAPQVFGGGNQRVTGISRDGSVVVGTQLASNLVELYPFRWTRATGVQRLPMEGGSEVRGEAMAVSADGNTVVIRPVASSGASPSPQLWRSGTTRKLWDLVADAGGAFVGTEPVAVSADGRTIVGVAGGVKMGDPNGPWKVTLP